jgi:hypothetical protein
MASSQHPRPQQHVAAVSDYIPSESELLDHNTIRNLYCLDYTVDTVDYNYNSNVQNANEGLIFPAGWVVGGDYLRYICIHNVSNRMLRISYQLPRSKYFSMEYPDPVDIAPGITYKLLINFRPVQTLEYHDYVTIISHTQPNPGNFYIPIKALLPKISYEFNPNDRKIDFNTIATNETTSKSFTIRNTGIIPFNYNISVAEPFELLELSGSGSILAGESKEFVLSITPLLAAHIQATAKIIIDSTYEECITLVAVSNIPHLTLDRSRINFSSVLTGMKSMQSIELTNHTNVSCDYQLHRVKSNQQTQANSKNNLAAAEKIYNFSSVFSFKPSSGRISANSKLSIMIQFTPLTTGTYSNEVYRLCTPGGNEILLYCTGLAVGPRVTLQSNIFQFNSIRLGEQLSKQVKLYNESSVAAYFDFNHDNHNSFKIQPSRGMIEAQLSVTVTITFKPKQPINYYNIIYCNLRNQQPELIHCVGSGFNEIQRPANLIFDHIRADYCNQLLSPHAALSYNSPLLNEQYELALFQSKPNFDQIFTQSNRFAVLDRSSINFNTEQGNRTAITITNTTNIKLQYCWDLHSNLNSTVHASLITKNDHYIVTPLQADVPPYSSLTLTIQFISPSNNAYFYQLLSCYVYPKTNRSFRLVDENAFLPPQRLELHCYSHTFDEQTSHYMSNGSFIIPQPKIKSLNNKSLAAAYLQFPPAANNTATYTTVFMNNPDDTPLQFNFINEASSLFRIAPQAGLIQPKQFQIFALQFKPNHNLSVNERMNSVVSAGVLSSLVNYSIPKCINLLGVSYASSLMLSQSTLYFKPTCLGSSCLSSVDLINLVSVPIVYRIEPQQGLEQIIQVQQPFGLIQANQILKLDLLFTPTQIRGYSIRVNLFYRSLTQFEWNLYLKHFSYHQLPHSRVHDLSRAITKQSKLRLSNQSQETLFAKELDYSLEQFHSAAQSNSLTLKLRGVCSAGNLEFNCSSVEFGPVAINSFSKSVIELTNHTNAAVKYSLHSMSIDNNESLELDHSGGELGGKSSQLINITYNPSSLGKHSFELQANIINEINHLSNDYFVANVSQAKMRLSGESCKGRLCVSDCRMEIIPNVSHIHSNFITLDQSDIRKSANIEEINTLLENEEDAAHEAEINFSFPSGIIPPQGSLGCCILYLNFTNTSNIVSEFDFTYPHDSSSNNNDSTLDCWYSAPQPTAPQRFIQAQIDEQIFTITPMKARLKPQQHATVVITYFYKYLGSHFIPIQLNLKQNRPILINLRGKTEANYNENLNLTHFPIVNTEQQQAMSAADVSNAVHLVELQPVALGWNDGDSPVQSVALYNPTQHDIAYQLDGSALADYAAANYNYPIFSCLNPRGIVRANSKAQLHWTFRPIQAEKVYRLNIDLTTINKQRENEAMLNHLLISARGYLPQHYSTAISTANQRIPRMSLIRRVGELARFSVEWLDLSVRPLNSCQFAIVHLMNHNSFPLSFQFHSKTNQQMNKQGNTFTHCISSSAAAHCAVQFLPSSGLVVPHQTLVIRVKVNTGAVPALFDEEFSCKLSLLDEISTGREEKLQQSASSPVAPSQPLILAASQWQAAQSNRSKGAAEEKDHEALLSSSSSSRRDKQIDRADRLLPLTAQSLTDRANPQAANLFNITTNRKELASLQKSLDNLDHSVAASANATANSRLISSALAARREDVLPLRITAQILSAQQIDSLQGKPSHQIPHFNAQQGSLTLESLLLQSVEESLFGCDRPAREATELAGSVVAELAAKLLESR